MSNDQHPSLDVIDIATPCDVSWDDMQGNERVRCCAACKLNVFDLSQLSRDAAEKLVFETEGRLCVRFFRRADGTVLTKDCPIGLRMLRRRFARSVAAISALVGFMTCGIVLGRNVSATTGPRAVAGPLNRLIEWIEPAPDVSFMGEMCVAPTPAPVPATPPSAQTNAE